MTYNRIESELTLQNINLILIVLIVIREHINEKNQGDTKFIKSSFSDWKIIDFHNLYFTESSHGKIAVEK